MTANRIFYVFLIVTLIVFDYLLFFKGVVDLLNLKPKDLVTLLTPLVSLAGILAAAGTGLYIMNKNHQDGEIKEQKKRDIADDMEYRRAILRIQEATLEADAQYHTLIVRGLDSLPDAILDFMKLKVDEIETNLKKNKDLPFYDIEKYNKIIAVSSKMLDEIFVLNIAIKSGNSIFKFQREKVIFERFENIYRMGEKFITSENFVYIPYDEILK